MFLLPKNLLPKVNKICFFFSEEAQAELNSLQDHFCREVNRLKCLRHQYSVLRELICNTIQERNILQSRFNMIGKKR